VHMASSSNAAAAPGWPSARALSVRPIPRPSGLAGEGPRAELADLRSRGVKIEEYDLPGLKTVDGVAEVPFGLMAWFIDPGKNCVGIIQLK